MIGVGKMRHRLILTRKKDKAQFIVTEIKLERGEIVKVRAESVEIIEGKYINELVFTFPCAQAVKRFKRSFKLSHLWEEA